MIPDAELVAQAIACNTEAYATLMRRHFDDAFRIAARLTSTREDAEDACQEGFARAYFRLDECRDPSRFRGWLMQIVRHHAHNVRRYQALRAALSLDTVADRPVSAGMHADAAEVGELRDALQRALATLSPVRQRVVRHYDVDGWSHQQVAEHLGISVAMSRRHLADAHAVLRARLGEAAEDFLSGTGRYE